MAEFKLGRIRFVWQGPWVATNSYLVDDVVSRGGKSYICVINHTSSAAFATDFTANPSKWNLVADGQTWRANWATSTGYNIGDLAKYGGIVYQCNTAHTSNSSATAYPGGLEADQSKWDVFATGFNWTSAWATGTRYRANDFVTYGGYTYVCITAHVSNASAASGLEADQGKWQTFNAGVTYLGAWNASGLAGGADIRYKLNDVVKYGSDLWICTTQHTSTGTTIDTAKFAIFVNGFQFENSWNNSTQYQVGDTVTYGGYSYIAKTNNLGSQPTTNASDWDPFTTGFNFRGDWSASASPSYKVGDLVRLGGYTYVATADNSNQAPPNGSYWARLNSGLQWTNNAQTYSAIGGTNLIGSGAGATFNVTRTGTVYTVARVSGGSGYQVSDTIKIVGNNLGGISPANDLVITVAAASGGAISASGGVTWTGYSVSWTSGVTYVLGDVVLFGANSYICVAGHAASGGNRPDADATGAYWNLLASGAEVATLTTAGDTFYYGANGPARLPVGTDGQILRVSPTGYPQWSYYGLVNNLVYVGPAGTDSPAPNYGLSIDKPWKTIRYAAKQVEDGYQNPNAKYLLQVNKQFFLKEVNNYIYYTYKATASGTSSNQFTCTDTTKLNLNMPVTFTAQTGSLQLSASSISSSTVYYIKTITAATSFTVSATPGGSALLATGTGTSVVRFAYDQDKTERDTGYAVESIIFDLTHGGNAKTTASALAYYTALGNAYITTGTQYQITQFIAAQTYLKNLITSALGNSAPAINYQTLNSVATPALQQINVNYTAETGTSLITQALSDIIITGMAAGTSTAIAVALQPNTTVSVKTGTFTEVLPIVVPQNTAINGDELRGTVVQPATANPLLVNDKAKTISALNRIKAVVPNLISNATVTPTTGNTQTQVTTLPAGSTGSTIASANLVTSANVIYDIVNSGAGTETSFVLPEPTGYNASYLIGYGDGKAQVIQNYAFIKADISQYISNNYNSVWTALGATGQALCQRDVSYILDALQYDLTYGGNFQSLIAGSAYYSNYVSTIAASERIATLAAYSYLKTLIGQVVLKSGVSPQAGNAVSWVTAGTAGSAGAATFAQARIQDIIDWITNGASPTVTNPSITWTSSALQTSFAALQAARSEIQSDAVVWVKKFYQNMNFNPTTCSRDAGLIVDALSYDMVFGSNLNAITAGRSYLRAIPSALIVINNQKAAELGAINFIKYKAKAIAAGGAVAQIANAIDDITAYITGGATPRLSWPNPSNINSGYAAGSVLLQDNKEFLKAEIATFMSVNYSSVWTAIVQSSCTRDVGYIVDAVTYDLKYGGNSASVQAAKAYYSYSTLQIAGTEKAAMLASITRLSTAVQAVIQDNALSVTSGNTATQVRKNGAQLAGSSGAAAAAAALLTIMYNIIDSGLTAGVPTITITTITGTNTFATGSAHGLKVNDVVIPQSTANGLASGTTYYVSSTPLGTTFTLSATFNGLTLSTFTNGTSLSIVAEKTILPVTSQVDTLLTAQAAALSSAKTSIQSSITTYISTNFPTVVYNSATCLRDVGYIVDAMMYDIMLNSNYRSVKAGMSYYTAQASVVIGTQKDATVNSYRYLKTQISTTVTSNATASSRAKALMNTIVNIIINGIGETPEMHGTVTYNNTLSTINAAEILRANRNFLAYEATAWISANFGGTVTYTTASGNVVNTTGAHNLSVGDPVRVTANTITTIATATNGTGNLITVGNTTGMIVGMPVVFSGTTFGGVSTGTTYYVKSIPTPGIGGTITVSSSTSAGVPGTVFALTAGTTSGSMGVSVGGTFGNLLTVNAQTGATVTYYVLTVPSSTSFTVTATQYSTTPLTLQDAGGVATVTYAYNASSCRRDMTEYVEAIIYDLQYVGTYKSLRAAKLYVNAVNGSLLENMYLVRNGTGIRNQTMTGLNGYLSEVNDYNTKRPTAGAYTSLDPGFGPNDSNSWITSRSCYTQNCTMFGTACSGMKIDAALHNGGNKSIVANDYTTIISDGIGVWCTGAGSLTELVSVFNYYGYAGYFAELGGRMRATNGNSSYGTYGVIAEGTDTFETPLYANLWNRGNPAQITNTVTDGTDKILRLEFGNAGSGYTNYNPSISGAGYNAAAIGDEYRDSSIFETRITDLNDGNGYGGSNYINAQNAAQTGDLVSVTVAASDQNLSTAYVGMRIQIVGGTGVGQYGNIFTYNNGSKIATVWKDSVAPFTITATTQGTPSSVTVASTAQMYANMPFYVASTVGGLTTTQAYYVAAVLNTTTFSVATTSGGTALTTAITTTTSQSVTMYAAGWDHVIPGTAIQAALDLTTSYIIEPRINYTAPGFRSTARTLGSTSTWGAVAYGQGSYVAITSTGTSTTLSTDGKTWGAGGALATSTSYADVVYIGGQGATATATVGGLGGQGAILTTTLGVANTTGGALADQIATVNIVNGGYGYTTAPTIVFTSGTGSGATATCTVLNGSITGVTIIIPGSGYATAPTASVVTDRITAVTVNTSGRNYTSAPAISLSYPAGLSPTAWIATTSVSLNAYLVVTATGKIYQVSGAGTTGPAAPVHTTGAVANGTASLTYVATQAQVTAVMSNSGITSFTIVDTGNSYTTVPTVTITDSYSRFVAIPTTNTNASYAVATAAASAWTVSTTALPTGSYAGAAYGGGYLIAVGGTASATRSLDGSTWVATPGAIPTTSGTYSSIAYGNNVFVAITTGANLTAYTANGTTWTQGGNLPSSTTWTSVAYGNGRFVAIASGGRAVAYSVNKGVSWTAAPAGLPSSQTWSKVAYGQGLFMAIAQGTTVCATSSDGVTWTERALQSSSNWKGLAFGNINSNPLWVATSNTSGTVGQSIVAGAQATGRIKITSNAVSEVRMIEPGSSYPKGAITAIAASNVINTGITTNLVDSQPVEFTGLDAYGLITNTTYYVIGSTIVTDTSFKVSATAGLATAVTLTAATIAGTYRAGPIVTQFDPNRVKTAPLRVRNGDGAIGNPSFTDRGTGNTTATASVTGDGYGDIYQPSNFINVKNMYDTPQAGANVVFSTIPNTWFKLVAVTNKLGSQGSYTATFQINPAVSVYQSPADGVLITTTLKYSQVRLTGHDFLYIGTGNKTQTNYPYVNASTASIANQALSSGGGRVFFTSTDQDGNFNVGNLFGVQQSTGTATLNASAFNLSGLQSLQLGQVAVGTGSATITQFSTDPYFTANSDSILPTQRAIKSYITAQIGGGQSSLNVNTLTSGVIYVANNTISTTTGVAINVKSKMNFTGGIDGAPVALGYFLQK